MELPVLNNQENMTTVHLIQKDDFADQSACLRCVNDGGGCCTGKGSGIFVTVHDVLRISAKNGMPLDSIAHFDIVDEKHLREVRETDPFFATCFRGNKTLQLIRKDDMCQFMVNGVGCSVFDVRPALCKLFPFTFDFAQDGTAKLVIPKADKQKWESCTIVEENYYRSKGATLKAMNSSKEVMMKLVVEHVDEIKQFSTYIDDLDNGVSLKEIVEKYGFSI